MNLQLALALIAAIIYGVIAWRTVASQSSQFSSRLNTWLVITLVVALISNLTFALDADETLVSSLTTSGLTVLGESLVILLLSHLTFLYLQRPYERRWLTLGCVWWGALLLTTITHEAALLGTTDWFGETFSPAYLPGIIALAGWTVIGAVSVILTFYAFTQAHLPEVANRAIFWALTLPLALMGAVLSATNSAGLTELGLVVALFGLLGIAYAALRLRVLDVRQNMQRAIMLGTLTLLSATVILIPLIIFINTDIEDNSTAFITAIVLAAVAALLHLGIFNGVSHFMRRLSGHNADVAIRLQVYAEAISGVVELEQLISVTMNQLRSLLNVQRGGLILIQPAEDNPQKMILKPHPLGMGEIPQNDGTLRAISPIYKRLLLDRKALLQFDIDMNPSMSDALDSEKAFFQAMHMAVYTPIVAQGEAIGLLCTGTQANDEPYSDQDLSLLVAIANHMGIALRNARLVDDLRRREKESSEANLELQSTKNRLEHLDSVKTDFITIASHELRTPLAQLRGYTDIIEAMNEQGMLDPEQLSSMTGNLRKATDRMEELIRNMLDVSQLDVNAMDLRFTQVTVENVVKLAIEPLTEAIRNRKQSLSARGLRGLPEIEGDMKRLVQAFQNVIVNAVKFTPDGGRIDISGSLETNPRTLRDEIVIAIQDTGIGIDPDNREIIFDKFVRTQDPSLHSTGKTKFMGAGPGLGLTIARGVIAGHGGRVYAESERYDPDNLPGSTFYIVLPIKPPDDATGAVQIESTTSIGTEVRDRLLKAIEQDA